MPTDYAVCLYKTISVLVGFYANKHMSIRSNRRLLVEKAKNVSASYGVDYHHALGGIRTKMIRSPYDAERYLKRTKLSPKSRKKFKTYSEYVRHLVL